MTELTTSTLRMPTAGLGPENPLPPLFSHGNLHNDVDVSEADEQLQTNAGYGRVPSVAPYLIQDRYSRERTETAHPVAILENKVLRATFLLGAGGRLWSLVHKPTGEELLFRNDILQPANLALRNAWFAGGVEWNIGTIGHAPGTFAPIHAARVVTDDGSPVLRLYEFDRIREVVYQIDAHLPEGSEALLIYVKIVNPNDHDVPMYWWSNIAVEQTRDSRVFTPADEAWNYSYDNTLRRVAVAPTVDADVTYPGRATDAADYFFDLGGAERPWIAAINGSGTGLVQTSTRQLRGRKLFLWGTGTGGRRWQRWLTGSERSYLEIQAGLARTQFEHLRMPANSEWAWVESYGRIAAPAESATATWPLAREAMAAAVEDAFPADGLTNALVMAGKIGNRIPVETLHVASGWGALEKQARLRDGDTSLELPSTPFHPESIGEEESHWLAALDGAYPELEPSEFPSSVQIHAQWERVLERSSGWTAAALRGVVQAYQGDLEGARASWVQSNALTPNALSWRNLAALDLHLGENEDAVAAYSRALALAPGNPWLAAEALRAFIAVGEYGKALELIDSLTDQERGRGRIRMYEAQVALRSGDLETVGEILHNDLEVPDLREGEDSLHRLWADYQDLLRSAASDYGDGTSGVDELPAHLDFRMKI